MTAADAKNSTRRVREPASVRDDGGRRARELRASPSEGIGVGTRARASGVVVESVHAEKTCCLKSMYLEKFAPLLKEEFAYTNIHQIPKVEKVVVNCGIGEASQNEKGQPIGIDHRVEASAHETRHKKPIATFKLGKAFIDKFRYNAKRVALVQSRINLQV